MADDSGKKSESDQKPMSKTLLLVGHGGYDQFKVEDKERATPGTGQVLVNVKTSGINFNELMVLQGMYDRSPALPAILGQEAGGIVSSVGEGVTKFKGGERVVCAKAFGLWTEYAVVNEDDVFEMPEGMSFEEAAALIVTYITAHIALFNYGNLRPNQNVLVHMAAGGVGTAATQLCKSVENVTVFGTSSAAKHDQIKENGVTHPIDYRTTDYVTEIRKISPDGVDIVLDPLAGEDSGKGFNLLKPFGKIIHFGGANFVSGPKKDYLAIVKTWWKTKSINPMNLMAQNRAVCGLHLGHMYDNPAPLRPVIRDVLQLYQDGKIKPVIDSVWAFEDVGKAMARIHDRLNIGKVVLSFDKEPLPESKPETKEKNKKTKQEKDGDKRTETTEEKAT